MCFPFAKKRPLIATSTCLAVLLAVGCNSTIKHQANKIESVHAAKFIECHIDFYSDKLRIGMPRQTVLSYLPKPQNTNTENVCVWVDKSTEAVVTQDRFDWQWLQPTRGGYFLVFVNDKLVTPLCANAAFDPWQALDRYAGMTKNQIQEILGPEATK
jgi:outer membrane protein assembly factor BamE (lipoprotein component of BamABCDE complex)